MIGDKVVFGRGTLKFKTAMLRHTNQCIKKGKTRPVAPLPGSALEGIPEEGASISHPPSVSLAPILPAFPSLPSLVLAPAGLTPTYFHLQILVQEEVAQFEVPVNDLIAMQVLAAQDYLPQVVAGLGLRQRFSPLVQLQKRLIRKEDITEGQGEDWPTECG